MLAQMFFKKFLKPLAGQIQHAGKPDLALGASLQPHSAENPGPCLRLRGAGLRQEGWGASGAPLSPCVARASGMPGRRTLPAPSGDSTAKPGPEFSFPTCWEDLGQALSLPPSRDRRAHSSPWSFGEGMGQMTCCVPRTGQPCGGAEGHKASS